MELTFFSNVALLPIGPWHPGQAWKARISSRTIISIFSLKPWRTLQPGITGTCITLINQCSRVCNFSIMTVLFGTYNQSYESRKVKGIKKKKIIQAVTLPSPKDVWDRLQLTPVSLNSG